MRVMHWAQYCMLFACELIAFLRSSLWGVYAQLCLTLCDPKDSSPPGSSVHGISQVRILEWVAISSSRGSSSPRDGTHLSCGSCIDRQNLYHWALQGTYYHNSSSSSLVAKSCPTLVTPWAVAFQAPLSMGFSRQECWSGLPFPSLGHLPDPGIYFILYKGKLTCRKVKCLGQGQDISCSSDSWAHPHYPGLLHLGRTVLFIVVHELWLQVLPVISVVKQLRTSVQLLSSLFSCLWWPGRIQLQNGGASVNLDIWVTVWSRTSPVTHMGFVPSVRNKPIVHEAIKIWGLIGYHSITYAIFSNTVVDSRI